MERQSSSDSEDKLHENDPESLDHKRKLSPSDASMREKRASTSSDSNACRRCKCKKSQCLKLYCECFAAGICCTDPCSCQGCLNRQEYEDKVLETKKQVESRDPHAFLPKVVPPSTALASNKDNMKGANVMTASTSRARHKKGCNCKKSMCQKKYCECYRAKVGCWNDCKCEGCKNVYGSGTLEDCVGMAPLDQSSPCSSTGSSDAKKWTNIPQSQECLYCPGSSIIPRNSFGEKEYVEPLDSNLGNTQRFQEIIVPASTNHTDHQQQMWLVMENESRDTNTPSNQVGHAPRPVNETPHEGLVLQPQLHVPGLQQLLPQNIEDRIAPQSNLVSPVSSLLAQNLSQIIGQKFYMFTHSQRQMPGMRHQVAPQQLQQQQQSQNPQQYLYQQHQPNQWQPSMMQTYFLPSLLQQYGQHSTDHFMPQQHSPAMSHQHQQQQSSIVRQHQTPMTLTQEPMLHELQQQQLIGPRSNATNIRVHAHMLAPPSNVGDIGQEEAHRLLSQQNNLTNLFSQFPPPSS